MSTCVASSFCWRVVFSESGVIPEDAWFCEASTSVLALIAVDFGVEYAVMDSAQLEW